MSLQARVPLLTVNDTYGYFNFPSYPEIGFSLSQRSLIKNHGMFLPLIQLSLPFLDVTLIINTFLAFMPCLDTQVCHTFPPGNPIE